MKFIRLQTHKFRRGGCCLYTIETLHNIFLLKLVWFLDFCPVYWVRYFLFRESEEESVFGDLKDPDIPMFIGTV